MALASGPQANQSNLAQANPTQQQFLQQQNMRLGMGLAQQQGQQPPQLASSVSPGMHPGLANNQAHLHNLAQQTNPALLSMMSIGANGMAQANNHLVPNILRPNGVLERTMLDPGMTEQLQAMQRARDNLNQQGGAAAGNQHIRLPSNEHNASPLLGAPHDQNLVMQQGLSHSPQPGNPGHPGLAQPQSVAIIQKLDSMPLRELEMRVATWRDNLPSSETRARELLAAMQRPGATPQIQAAFARAKQDFEQNRFLFAKSQEILMRKQSQLQGQNSARMTPTNAGEPNRPGSRAAGQASGMSAWQGQPGPSATPQIPPQPSPRNTSAASFQPTPSPQPNADQQAQQTSSQFRPGAGRQTAIPRDRQTFSNFLRMWSMQTGRSIDGVPKIGDKPLDLYQMYIEVEGLGGPEKVQATGLWHLVAMKMGYVTHDQNDPQLAHIAKILAEAYNALLIPFDRFCVERMHAVSVGMNQQRAKQLQALQSMGVGAVPGVGGGVDPALRSGILPNENANLPPFQRVFAYIHTALKDWMPELPPQAKIMRVAQMDIPQMQQLGWPEDRISLIVKFKPMLMNWRATIMRQQALQAHQQPVQGGPGQLMNPQLQQHQLQLQSQQALNDPRSSHSGGSLPPSMQAANIQGITGPVKLPFPTDVTQRARLVIESLSREIEQTRQYQRRDVPEPQRVQMNQAVVNAYPLAVEFERTASLHFMLFNNQQQTRQFLDQAALLREQHRYLQGGQQHYIMSFEEVTMVQDSLRMAIHTLKAAYAQRVKQHQEQMAGFRTGGQMSQQQIQQQAQQHQQQLLQQQQQLLASQLGANVGLSQPPLVQQRPPSQPQYGSPKPDPSKPQLGLGQPPKAAPQTQVKQRKPVASGSQPTNTPSPAAATPSNMESAPTPSSVNEPATPKSPRGAAKNKLPVKRTPSQGQKAKKGPGPLKLEMLPPLSFDQPTSNKRQREDEAPPVAEPVMPVAGPSSPKRIKTEFESTDPIKYEYSNDNPIESMDEAVAQLQSVAPGPNGDGIDPDVLAQLNEFLEGPMGGPSGSTQPQLNDQQADVGPKVEDVFDFSYYINDSIGDDAPDADTPDLNTNKETPDSAADDIEHLGQRSPGKGEAPAGDAKGLAGSRASTLTEGFWEAFDDGEMPEGAYFMGGGANGFNWNGPIDANATSWIGITGTAA
ncbi:hypothetical protein FRC08_017078 [Ceratobasidium sp. 394]|nr:hypothetical protein FRC08_017078 [Ceratobasidium sp. 394]